MIAVQTMMDSNGMETFSFNQLIEVMTIKLNKLAEDQNIIAIDTQVVPVKDAFKCIFTIVTKGDDNEQ